MIRQPIYSAIVTQLAALTAPPYSLDIPGPISEAVQHWSDVQVQPAIFLDVETETSVYKYGEPLKWTISASVWVYAKKQGNTLGVQLLRPILDGIESVLSPTQAQEPYLNTLGGLVTRCAISGKTQINGGFLGDQAVARMA